MKRTFRQINGKFVEVTHKAVHCSAYVQPDYPDYESPIDGRVVHGKKGRRYDLARSSSRPWEGMEQERKEVDRDNRIYEQHEDRRLDESVKYAIEQMHPDSRKRLLYG